MINAIGTYIGGQRFGSAAPGLIDIYGNSVAAYSLDRISRNYGGNAITVVRDGDLAPIDVGFDVNGELNVDAIVSHCGSSIGRVSKWYDQSGLLEDVSNPNHGDRPLIYDGSSVYSLNGKPSVYFSGFEYLYRQYLKSTYSQPNTFSVVANAEYELGIGMNIFDGYGSSRNSFFVFDGSDTFSMFAGNPILESTKTAIGFDQQFIGVGVFNSTSSNLMINDVEEITNGSTGSSSFLGLYLGTFNGTFGGWRGHVQEFVLWNSNLYSSASGISDEINLKYNSY